MDIMAFEEDKLFVVNSLRDGKFDYLEVVNEVSEKRFFEFLFNKGIIDKLTKKYPTPRVKEEVPLWFYISSQLNLKLHRNYSYYQYPLIIKNSGMLGLIKSIDHTWKEDEKMELECSGFNNKNKYARKTPCDLDYLRKMALDTESESLHNWYNNDVIKIYKNNGYFDSEGIFIGDASYLFVPNNKKYIGSSVLLFDENNQPVSAKKNLTKEQLKRCQYRRCYKIVSLIHTNRKKEFFIYCGIRLVSGKTHEAPIFYKMLKRFIKAAGVGVIKLLLLDRGFIDGKNIGLLKQKYGIDVIIPVKKNMDIYKDAMGMIKYPEMKWIENELYKSREDLIRDKPEDILRREATRQKTLAKKQLESGIKEKEKKDRVEKMLTCGIKDFKTWESCPVPMNMVINREIYTGGKEEVWCLMTTEDFTDPRGVNKDYALRWVIEERHRQLKCYWNLNKFKSTNINLITAQIIFVLLVYSLLQIHLYEMGKSFLNQMTPVGLEDKLKTHRSYMVLYYKNKFCLLSVYEYQELLLRLEDKSRESVLKKTIELKNEFYKLITNRRPP